MVSGLKSLGLTAENYGFQPGSSPRSAIEKTKKKNIEGSRRRAKPTRSRAVEPSTAAAGGGCQPPPRLPHTSSAYALSLSLYSSPSPHRSVRPLLLQLAFLAPSSTSSSAAPCITRLARVGASVTPADPAVYRSPVIVTNPGEGRQRGRGDQSLLRRSRATTPPPPTSALPKSSSSRPAAPAPSRSSTTSQPARERLLEIKVQADYYCHENSVTSIIGRWRNAILAWNQLSPLIQLRLLLPLYFKCW